MGWVSLLRGESCELIQASEPCVCLLIPSDALVTAWRASELFLQFFLERSTPSELSYVLLRALADVNAPPADEESWLRQAIARAKLHSGVLPELDDKTLAILSSAVDAEYGHIRHQQQN